MKSLDSFLQQTRLSRLTDVILAGLIGVTLVVALASDAGAVPRNDEIPFGEGVLWRVERPGEEPSHVFGTVHLNRDDILAVPESVKKALAGSRSAAFEVKMDDRTVEKMGAAYFTFGRKTLDALIGPDLFAEVVEAGEPYGFSVHFVRHLQPWAIYLFYGKAPSVVEDEEDEDGKPILDDWLYEQAEEKGIPTFGLEPVRQHFSPFMDLPLESQKQLVVATLEQMDIDQTEVERRHAEFVRRYLNGEIAAIMSERFDGVSEEHMPVFKDLYRRLLEDRNHLMVERMMPRLKAGKAFVAVGAGHLPGNEGILALLAERGYQISRVH